MQRVLPLQSARGQRLAFDKPRWYRDSFALCYGRGRILIVSSQQSAVSSKEPEPKAQNLGVRSPSRCSTNAQGRHIRTWWYRFLGYAGNDRQGKVLQRRKKKEERRMTMGRTPAPVPPRSMYFRVYGANKTSKIDSIFSSWPLYIAPIYLPCAKGDSLQCRAMSSI